MHSELGQASRGGNVAFAGHSLRPLAIDARGLRKTFEGTVAVEGVDLAIPEGEISTGRHAYLLPSNDPPKQAEGASSCDTTERTATLSFMNRL